MIKRWLLLAFSLYFPCALSAVPNSSYYLYDGKPLNLNKASFNRYVVPQLRAMNREYHHILKKLHPIHEDLVPLKDHLASMRSVFKDFQHSCQNNESDCVDAVVGLYLQSRKLDRLLLSMHRDRINFSQLRHEKEISSLMTLIHSLDEMAVDNYKFMHGVEEYLITVNTHYFPLFRGKTKLEPILYKMSSTSELIQTFLLKEKLKQDFDFAWHHFFRLIEEHIIREKRIPFILKRLENLNMAWNTFHMKITKGNHNLPKSITSIAKIMHNRWNSILKIILRG